MTDYTKHSVREQKTDQAVARVTLGLFRLFWRRLTRNKLNLVSLGVILLMVIMALAAPWITPFPYDQVAPAEQWQAPSAKHWLGTDQYGRDILSRCIYGARVSLFVGIVAVTFSLILGVLLGACAGYFGGVVDEVIMRIMDMFMAIPAIILAIAFVAMLGPNLRNLIIAIAVYRIAQFARVTRGSVLSLKEQEFIEACRAMGQYHPRIVFRHLLPNCLAPIVVLASVIIGNIILTEATLSFLGLGIQPPMASWGVMISDGNEYLMFAPWMSVFPGLFLMVTMLAFNLLGDGLRDALDPRLKEQF
jgi:peptide/nickel transport system permease protein